MLGHTSRDTLNDAPAESGSLTGSAMAASESRSSQLDRWMVERLLNGLGRPAIAVQLWDGQRVVVGEHNPSPEITVRLHDCIKISPDWVLRGFTSYGTTKTRNFFQRLWKQRFLEPFDLFFDPLRCFLHRLLITSHDIHYHPDMG